jgi:hypothetical protein
MSVSESVPTALPWPEPSSSTQQRYALRPTSSYLPFLLSSFRHPTYPFHAVSLQSQEKNYAFLLDLQKFVIDQLKDGAVAKDVCNSALDYVKEHKPELEPHFVKSLGSRVCFLSLCFPLFFPKRCRS